MVAIEPGTPILDPNLKEKYEVVMEAALQLELGVVPATFQGRPVGVLVMEDTDPVGLPINRPVAILAESWMLDQLLDPAGQVPTEEGGRPPS